MSKLIYSCSTLFLLLFSYPGSYGQMSGGGPYEFPARAQDCILPQERADVLRVVERNSERLQGEGILPSQRQPGRIVLFSWPLQAAPSLTDYNYYGISNYVDHNPAFPDELEDWNCGQRSYDTNDGYNHAGIDIFTWPFPWHKMDNDEVHVLAAAPGVIVAKNDGAFDRQCSFNSDPANYVIILHADGSEAWYWHLKNGSVTNLSVGANISTGEYLGVVGSSGNSTGPHLHFEVHDVNGDLIDPYAGPCNGLNASSWWLDQKPYYESRVNKLMTNSAPVGLSSGCSNAVINGSNNFEAGETAYFTAFYQDQLAGQVSQYRILRPDNSTFDSWTHSSQIPHFAASYWWWNRTLPNDAPSGTWKFQVVYQGNTYTHEFTVGGGASACPTGSVVMVTNANDSGDGSLRQAIECANADPALDIIQFSLPGTGTHIIAPLTPLPPLTDAGISIIGSSQPGWARGRLILDGNSLSSGIGIEIAADGCSVNGLYITGFPSDGIQAHDHSNVAITQNVLSGNGAHGAGVFNCTNVLIEDNHIGVDATGTAPEGNFFHGIRTADVNTCTIVDNVIGDNGRQGIGIGFANTSDADYIIEGNYIGTNVTGVIDLGNAFFGIDKEPTSTSVSTNIVIRNNIIAFHSQSAVGVYDSGGQNWRISQNSMYCNNQAGILLASGANNNQSAPGITAVSPGQIAGTASAGAVVEVFVNDPACPASPCQGKVYLGSVTAAANGAWTLNAPFATTLNQGDEVTATATSASGNTSAFSPCATVGSDCSSFVSAGLLLNGPSTLCEGEQPALSLSTVGGDGPYSLEIGFSDGSSMFITAVDNGGNISVSISESTAIQILNISDVNGCPAGSLGAPVDITVTPSPPANPAGPLLACDGLGNQNFFDLTSLDGIINGGSGANVSWYTDAGAANLIDFPDNYLSGPATVYAVVDNGACSSAPVPVQLQLISSPVVSAEVAPQAAVACVGQAYEIRIDIQGGTPPFQVDLQENGALVTLNNITSGSLVSRTQLAAGDYSYFIPRIVDALGCESFFFTILPFPGPDFPTVSIQNSITPVFNFEITFCNADPVLMLPSQSDNGVSGSWDIGPAFDPASHAGMTTVITFTPFGGDCASEAVIQMTVNQQPLIDDIGLADPSDCGQQDGSITVQASGAGLEYSIDGGNNWQGGNAFAGLSDGNYTVGVRENGITGCEIFSSVSLASPQAPVINGVTSSPETGCGPADGAITVQASGANGSLEYSIDNGQNWQPQNTFAGLPAGTYLASVRDVNATSCIATESVTIGSIPALMMSCRQLAPASGPSTADGVIELALQGGAGPYLLGWPGGSMNIQDAGVVTIAALLPGTYLLTLTDANACTMSCTAVVETSGGSGVTTFYVDTVNYSLANDTVTVPINVLQFQSATGFQLSLSTNGAFVGVQPEAAFMDGFDWNIVNDSLLALLWSDVMAAGVSVADSSTAFYVQLVFPDDGSLCIELAFTGSPTEIWMVLEDASEFEPLTIDGVVCPPQYLDIAGNIHTEELGPAVEVEVNCSNGEMQFTDAQGDYLFEGMERGADYILTPYKDIDPLNGVNVADIVLIRDHLLGENLLSSGYKRIAADVDGSQYISIIDIVIIRQLILGFETAFPNVTSWRYIPEDFPLIMPADNNAVPDYVEYIDIVNLQRDSLAADFIATKTGDVNHTAASLMRATDIFAEDVSFKKGELVTARLALSGPEAIAGYQFAMEIDESYLQYTGVLSDGSSKEKGDYHNYSRKLNIFKAIGYGDAEAVWVIQFIAQREGKLSMALKLLNRPEAASVAYTKNGELNACRLNFIEPLKESAKGLTLVGSQPNPFTDRTQLLFDSEREQLVQLEVYSIDGYLVHRESRKIDEGRYAWKLDGRKWQRTGLFYFKATTAEGPQFGVLIRE